MGTPTGDENVGRSRLDTEIEEQQGLVRQEFATIAGSIALAPPVKPLSRAVTPELFPDSMGSRISALASTPHALASEDLSFDRMGSRISSTSVAV
jgi:glucosamine-6-phosphate deaminase